MFLSTRTSNNRTWNTGNGSPDAICFSGKQIFLLIHKWIPMLFYITVSPLNFLVVNTVKCILGLIEFGNYCLYCTVRWLKVRKFQMQFMVSSIHNCPKKRTKNQKKIDLTVQWYLRLNFFFRFLGDKKTPQFAFEIYLTFRIVHKITGKLS